MNSADAGLKRTTAFIEKYYKLLFILIIALALFNIFYKINISNTDFDEARHGISAYEMLKNHEFIVNTFNYKNDYWNLKPPVSFWMIILGYKIFGFNMLGLRFFSCLSAFLTILVVGLFVKQRHGKLSSLISLLILSTTSQFIIYHSARNAEADAAFVLFFTLSVISIIMTDKNIKFLYLSGFFAALAFLTKSWHMLPLICIAGLYILGSRLILDIKFKKFFIYLGSFIMPVLLWAVLRIQKDGLAFLKAMVEVDLLHRSAAPLEGHVGGVSFYFTTVYGSSDVWIILFILLGGHYVLSRPLNKKIRISNYSFALGLWLIVPMILYTIAKTKIWWYILPVYPPLAIIFGAFLAKNLKKPNINRYAGAMLLAIIITGALANEVNIYDQITSIKNDNIELSLKEMGKDRKYTGYNVYTASGVYGKEGTWQQVHIFSAELWCDFKTVNGGFNAFLNNTSNNSLILMPSDENTKNSIKQYNLKVIEFKNGFYLISHQL